LLFRNGKPAGLYDIEVAEDARRKGVGADVVETLLTAADGPVEISNILPAARSFWASVGVGEQNVEATAAYNGILDWNQFARSPAGARRGIPRRTQQADRDEIPSLAGLAVEERELTDAERAIFDGFGRREPTRDGSRRYSSRGIAPLEGVPTVEGATGPDPGIVAVAEQYARDQGIDLVRQAVYVDVDEGFASQIAQAYADMRHAPQDARVKRAYEELKKQTRAQYDALVAAGYRFWFVDEATSDYGDSPFNAMRDLRRTKSMGVFPTKDGFGNETTEADVIDNPLLEDTGLRWPTGSLTGETQPVTANDLFRAVHDAFGHGLEGAGFRARGEENAWQAHRKLYTGDAIGAMTTETRGQNSWLNFGPLGAKNRNAKVEDTIFADQKTGLLPEWAWQDRIAPSETFEQSGGVKGRFNPNTFTIKLLEQADLSTFLHESGHLFLEMLFGMASAPDMAEGIKKDAAIVLKWFGFKGPDALAQWNALSVDEKRPYHERWAESFELYLFRGQAPSVALQPVFAKFRAWLKRVYVSLRDFMRNHDTKLTDEVTGVFDRLLATDEQIEEAERLAEYTAVYKDAESAGLTPQEWMRYQEMNARATDNSAAALQARSLRDLKWTLNAQSKELKKLQREVDSLRKSVREETTAEVDLMPVHALRADIARKNTPRIFRPALEQVFGSEEQATWRQLPDSLLTDNAELALPPEVLSEMYGFDSVHDMVQKLVFTAPRDEDIEAITEQKLLERYGDLTTPEGMAQAAQEAVHNEARARFTATELAMMQAELSKTAPSATNPKRKVNILVAAAKGYAERLIAARRVDQLSPSVFWNAEARAQKRADKALIGKDRQTAITAKRDALLNHYAGRYAVEARKEIERKVEFLKSFDKKEKRANLPVEYMEQIDGLLERFDLRASTTQRDIKRKAALSAWVAQQEELGLPPEIDPALLDEARKVSYKTLTVEEIRGLYDTVKSIEHLGRLKNKLLTAKDNREFKAVTEQLVAAALASTTKRRKVRENAATKIEQLVDSGREWLAEHRKIASYIRQLDSFEDGGIWWETLGRTMNAAADKKTASLKKAAVELQEIFKELEGDLSSRVEIPEIGKALTLETRLSFAFNYGNSGNRQRLLDGHQYTDQQMQAILSTLTLNQWKFIEAVWKHIDSYWLEIKAKQERVTGVAPEKVEAEPFTIQLRDGTVFTSTGGYYPIKADATTSIKAAGGDAAEILQQMRQGKFVSATTRRGHTRERSEKSNAVLRKDIGVIFEHVNQVLHDLAWHEWLVDANRLIRDASVDKALRVTLGPEGQKQFSKALEDIALGDLPAQTAFERGVGHLRKGTSIVGMGWNLTTAALQVSGLSQSIVRVGARWVALGVGRMLGDAARLENVAANVHARSEFMRHRADTFTREVNEIRATVYAPKKAALQSTYFYLIAKMQMMVDIPTWLGAYEKAIASGADEAKAVALADQAVRDSQGGGGISDLAQIQRGSQFQQLFTNFYSYFNVTFNLTAERFHETDFTNPIEVGFFMVDMLLLYSVPVAYSVLLKSVLIGGEDDEEKIAAKLAREQVSYLLGTVVGLRELSSVAAGFAGYSGPAGTRFFSDVAKTIKEMSQGEVDTALVKAANSAAGAVLHYPAGQVNRTMEGIIALQDGETQNPAVLLFGPQKDKP
jgi:hypothetical protein